MTRSEILDHAKAIVTKDREATHGQPERNLGLIAALWSAYLEREVTPVDVTMLMVLLKAARIKGNPGHMDSFTDICGYASLGGEMSAPMPVKITPEITIRRVETDIPPPQRCPYIAPGDRVRLISEPSKKGTVIWTGNTGLCGVCFDNASATVTYWKTAIEKI